MINFLKPRGLFTYHQVENSKILHGARFALCVLYGFRNRERLSLYTSLLIGFYNRGGKFPICHPSVFPLTHKISILSVIHTIYSIIQTNIQGLHVSTVYGHLQALLLNQSMSYLKYISCAWDLKAHDIYFKYNLDWFKSRAWRWP